MSGEVDIEAGLELPEAAKGNGSRTIQNGGSMWLDHKRRAVRVGPHQGHLWHRHAQGHHDIA
jgi:hypothetical protein